MNAEFILPDGVICDKPAFKVYLPHWTPLTEDCETDEIRVKVTMPELPSAATTLYLRLKADGGYAIHMIPVVFIMSV